MTIFLNALKKLMKDELSELVVTLLSRTESYSASFHNPDLSHEQLEKIIALDSDIVHFKSTGNDGDDVKKITELVNCTLNDIRDIRSRHRASRDDGDTVTCLNNLRMQIPAFYKKIEDVRFDATSPSYLLNKLYTKTPEHIVYYHGICYLGDGIFNAKSGGDADIRTAKEESVKTRFNQINGEMKPEYDLQNQLTRIFRYLTDLHRDNEDAIKQDESSLPFALPSIKLLNVLSLSAPIEWFSPGLGNLAKEFNMALRKIVAIQTDDFGKPDELVGSFEKQTSSLFLLVLKKQYKIVLSRLIKNLRDQIDTHYGYDADLSKDQHEQIILLDAQLDSFQGTGNDANDVATLMHLIDVGLSKSQDIRKSHKKYPDEGNTITNLYNLKGGILAYIEEIGL